MAEEFTVWIDEAAQLPPKAVSFFKQEKKRESEHLAFIRRLPCIRCGGLGCQAAHISRNTDSGTATKASDIFAVPLCPDHHRLQHQIGEVSFFGDIEAAKDLARYLYSVTGDIIKACAKILRFKGSM